MIPSMLSQLSALSTEFRRKAGSLAIEGLFEGLAKAGQMHPRSRPERHQVEVIKDIPYIEDSALAAHRLDVYRSTAHRGPYPVLFYIHGGGFRILSKETHWLMALLFARRGYLVFNINYRLAPKHPFPAPLSDTCEAFAWVEKNAHRFGGDMDRLVVSGESAGGNLACALTAAMCFERKEAFAQKIFALDRVPKAVVPACGYLDVSSPQRFSKKYRIPKLVNDRIVESARGYLPSLDASPESGNELSSPLLVYERGEAPKRALPPFFIPVGTRDPLKDDTRRLKAALDGLGVSSEDKYYDGGVHAFHAFIWQPQARNCWGDTFDWLGRQPGINQPRP